MPVESYKDRVTGFKSGPSLQAMLDDDELIEPATTMEIGFAKVVVVDNIPQVPEEKHEKLKGVLTKLFTAAGPIRELVMPVNEAKVTRGWCFIEFQTYEAAETAVAHYDNYKLDRQHIFRVNSFEDFKKYESVTEDYVPPEPKPYEPRENLRSWLLNEDAVDQYLIKYENFVEILWNDWKQGKESTTDQKRQGWTDTYCAWSPKGTYLLTIYTSKGVAVWGGAKWEKLMRFPHPGVQLVDWSPCERYLVTASPQFQNNDNPKDPQCIIVWDVRSGAKLRGFVAQSHHNKLVWPAFKWSGDGKYLARMGEDCISVYETPSMNLLDKKSIKIEGVKDFSWSPTDHIISYFVPEHNNKPASVVLMEIPSRSEKRQRNLVNVADCVMHWHPKGDYLCVKVDRLTKTKKSTYTIFEIFRMREKAIPTEQLEMKENVVAFAWEPQGNRFAVIHGDAPRFNVSFYALEHQIKHLKTLEKKSANNLFWSPQGGFIVLAGLGNLNGALEFFNVNDMESMGTEEHIMCTNVDWDPSGRYVTSVVSAWRQQLETGYNIYSFSGKLLKRVLKDKFYQLLWRPRPPSLLPEERIKDIEKNIQKYAVSLEAKEREEKEKRKEEFRRQREALRKKFEEFMRQKEEQYKAQVAARKELRDGEESEPEEDYYYVDQWMEEVEDVKEIIVEDS